MFQMLAENEGGVKNKSFIIDYGGEFLYDEFKSYCDAHGIKKIVD